MKLYQLICIACVLSAEIMHAQSFQTGDHELLITPTGQTLPAGSHFLSVIELFYLNFNYSPIDGTQLGVGIAAPAFDGFASFLSFQVKQGIYSGHGFSASVWANYLPYGRVLLCAPSVTYKFRILRLNASGGLAYNSETSDKRFIYSIGGTVDLFWKLSVLAENVSHENWGGEFEDRYLGLVLRYTGSSFILDIGFVSMYHDGRQQFNIPAIKMAYQF